MRPSTPPRTEWFVDPRDPRAPPTEVWDAMTEAERARVVDSLPSDPGWEVAPPEGDEHYDASDGPRKILRRFFGRTGRRAYVGTNLSVYYPNEPVFAPDVSVVLDVDPRRRRRWTVSAEGKGLDLIVEVHVAGDWRKDFVANVERYARLAVQEYFAFNLRTGVLVGHRLNAAGTYDLLEATADGFRSEVLGLDLLAEGERIRFFNAGAPLPELDELVVRLEGAMTSTLSRLSAVERELEEERAARERETAARERETAARERETAAREQAEARVAALEREIAELKKR